MIIGLRLAVRDTGGQEARIKDGGKEEEREKRAREVCVMGPSFYTRYRLITHLLLSSFSSMTEFVIDIGVVLSLAPLFVVLRLAFVAPEFRFSFSLSFLMIFHEP